MTIDNLFAKERQEQYEDAMHDHIENNLNMLIVECFQSKAASALFYSRKDIVCLIKRILEEEFKGEI